MFLSFLAAKGKREPHPKETYSQEDNRAVVQSCWRNRFLGCYDRTQASHMISNKERDVVDAVGDVLNNTQIFRLGFT